MLKQDVINGIRGKLADKTKKECEDFLDAFVAVVTDALASGEEVKIVNFGTFKTRKILKHDGIDPQSKKKIVVPEMTLPCFKAGKALKEAVG